MIDEERLHRRNSDRVCQDDESMQELENENLSKRDENRISKTENKRCYIDIEERINKRKLERKHKKKKRKIGCIAICIPIIIILIFIIIFMTTYRSLLKWDKEKENLPVPAATAGNELNPIKDELVFLLLGIDEKVGDEPQRTDTMMLFDIDFSTGKIQAVSIPRDTYCYIDGDKDKINHAYAYGEIELTIKTVRDLLGIDLDYYMIVDYNTVKAVIDAGGGVKYDVPEDTVPQSWETFTTGEHVLDGEEALSFLRHRSSYFNGDIGRVKKQENFLKSAAYQILNPKNLLRYPAIFNAVKENMQTNIPVAPFTWRFFEISKLDYSNIEWNVLPGDGVYIDDISYYALNADDTTELINRIFQNSIIKRPKLIDLSEVDVDDENSSNENFGSGELNNGADNTEENNLNNQESGQDISNTNKDINQESVTEINENIPENNEEQNEKDYDNDYYNDYGNGYNNDAGYDINAEIRTEP